MKNFENDIENDISIATNSQSLYENWWFLSQCFRLLGDTRKAQSLLKRSQEIIIATANKISDVNQRKYFLEENIFNRKVLKECPI